MNLLMLACLALVLTAGCRSREITKRHAQSIDSELSTEQPVAQDPEPDEGAPAFFVAPDKITFEFQSPQKNEVGRGLTIKIAPDAFAEVPYGETIGLALYRLNELTREAVYESDGRRRVRAKKVAAMDIVYEEGQAYEFPVVDMTGAFKSPLVLKIVPLTGSPEGDASVFLPKAEKTIRGVYILTDKGNSPKVFDVQTLRLDVPDMLDAE